MKPLARACKSGVITTPFEMSWGSVDVTLFCSLKNLEPARLGSYSGHITAQCYSIPPPNSPSPVSSQLVSSVSGTIMANSRVELCGRHEAESGFTLIFSGT
jgi:hypothetical protein